MLKMGATSFWEDFDIDWIENACPIDRLPKEGEIDIHGDYGKFCYMGFRHSFCHGWSAGVVQFLIDNVLGIRAAEPGFKKVVLKPDLGDLEYAKGQVPTPYGVLKVEVNKTSKGVKVDYDAPNGIEVVVVND